MPICQALLFSRMAVYHSAVRRKVYTKAILKLQPRSCGTETHKTLKIRLPVSPPTAFTRKVSEGERVAHCWEEEDLEEESPEEESEEPRRKERKVMSLRGPRRKRLEACGPLALVPSLLARFLGSGPRRKLGSGPRRFSGSGPCHGMYSRRRLPSLGPLRRLALGPLGQIRLEG